jgi:hypothetical protein
MINMFNKRRMQRKYLNLMNNIYIKPIVNTILNDKRWDNAIQHITVNSCQHIKLRKGNKRHTDQKGRNGLSLFPDDTMGYIESPKGEHHSE